MKGMNRKRTWYLVVVLCIWMLALGGCPKKAEISYVPETQREEKPAAEAPAQSVQKVEAAKPEAVEAGERAAVTRAGLQPVYFDYDQAIIEVVAGEVMRANAEWLKAHPLRGDLELLLDPATRLPLQLRGRAKVLGQITIRLRKATMR